MFACVVKAARSDDGGLSKVNPDLQLVGWPANYTVETFIAARQHFGTVCVHFGDLRGKGEKVVEAFFCQCGGKATVRWFSTARDGLPRREEFLGRVVEVERWDQVLDALRNPVSVTEGAG